MRVDIEFDGEFPVEEVFQDVKVSGHSCLSGGRSRDSWQVI